MQQYTIKANKQHIIVFLSIELWNASLLELQSSKTKGSSVQQPDLILSTSENKVKKPKFLLIDDGDRLFLSLLK